MSAISRTMRVLARTEVVASWASEAGRASTLGELLAIGHEPDDMPPDVTDAWQDLLLLPLGDLTSFTRKFRLAALAETLLSGMQPSRRLVFKERCLALDPPSLEALGYQMRITRERVRQLEEAAEETVKTALQQPRFKVLQWRAKTLTHSIGAAVPADHALLETALQDLGGTGDIEDVTDRLLLWLAGPYKQKHGWLVSPRTVVPRECSRLIELADGFGVIGLRAKTGELLSALGIPTEVHDAWLGDCRYVRVFEDTAIVSRGSVADKSVPILAVLGKPQTPERLAELVDEGHSPMTVRNAVYRDSRFVRCSKQEFGLSAWGLEPFPTRSRSRIRSQITPASVQ